MLAEEKKFTAQLLVAVSKKVSSQKHLMRRENLANKLNFHSPNPQDVHMEWGWGGCCCHDLVEYAPSIFWLPGVQYIWPGFDTLPLLPAI
jgi:hypothetical protein